jgi:hypothetical protein
MGSDSNLRKSFLSENACLSATQTFASPNAPTYFRLFSEKRFEVATYNKPTNVAGDAHIFPSHRHVSFMTHHPSLQKSGVHRDHRNQYLVKRFLLTTAGLELTRI